jgi:hypothetical protein
MGTVGADFDGDGDVDVATAGDFGQGNTLLLRNTGTAAFGAPSAIAGTKGVQALATGDVDGDGDGDLVGMTSNAAIVLRNDGSGQFTATQSLPLTIGAQAEVILADADGDGDLDVVSPTFSAIQTLRNNGAGIFAVGPTAQVLGASSLSAIASANLDGTGPRDLLAADGGSGTVYALRGASNGIYTVSGQLYGAGFGLEDVAAVDLDGDGVDDAATVGSFSFTLGTGLGNGQGGFKSSLSTVGPGGWGPTSLGAGDLDRDGDQDLLVSFLASPNPGMQAYLGNGTVKPTPGGLFATGPAPQNPVIRDLDGDNRLDVVTAAPNSLYVLRNTTP